MCCVCSDLKTFTKATVSKTGKVILHQKKKQKQKPSHKNATKIQSLIVTNSMFGC